jgi:hypothetical protein
MPRVAARLDVMLISEIIKVVAPGGLVKRAERISKAAARIGLVGTIRVEVQPKSVNPVRIMIGQRCPFGLFAFPLPLVMPMQLSDGIDRLFVSEL